MEDYNSIHTGTQIDAAVSRALSGGEIDDEIAAMRAQIGSPLTAQTKAAMTDTEKIYVYTGSEAGMIKGNWYYWTGTAWASGGVYNAIAFETDKTLSIEGDAADAQTVGDALRLAMITRSSIAAGDDLDDYKIESGMHYCSQANAGQISHSPWTDISFALFVKCGTTASATSGQAQFAISGTGFAWRYNFGGWSAWKYSADAAEFLTLESESLRYRGSVGTTVAGPDALKQIGSYYIAAARSAAWVSAYGFPSDKASRLTTFGGSGSSAAALGQIVSSDGRIWLRASNGSGVWSDWREIASVRGASCGFEFGLFQNFSVLGGSYDSGYSYNSGGIGITNYARAWGTLAAKTAGNTAHIYAAPGTSIPEWYDPAYSHAERCVSMFREDDPCDLYITTFGANDDETLGTISDCENYDPAVTPTTFYGWYAKLIHDIKEKAPGALIVMTTPSSEGILGTWAAKIAAIREIAAFYQLPVIRWMDDNILSEELINYTSVSSTNHPHPTPMGHAMLAAAWPRLLDRCVYSNPDYFNAWRNES